MGLFTERISYILTKNLFEKVPNRRWKWSMLFCLILFHCMIASIIKLLSNEMSYWFLHRRTIHHDSFNHLPIINLNQLPYIVFKILRLILFRFSTFLPKTEVIAANKTPFELHTNNGAVLFQLNSSWMTIYCF